MHYNTQHQKKKKNISSSAPKKNLVYGGINNLMTMCFIQLIDQARDNFIFKNHKNITLNL